MTEMQRNHRLDLNARIIYQDVPKKKWKNTFRLINKVSNIRIFGTGWISGCLLLLIIY